MSICVTLSPFAVQQRLAQPCKSTLLQIKKNHLCISVSTCYVLNVCVLLKFICWNSILLCDGGSRWGLWEVKRGNQKGGAHMNGISTLTKVRRSLLLLSLYYVKVEWEVGHLQPGGWPSLDLNCAGSLILNFQSPKLWENQCLLFRPPSLWYPVITSQAKTQLVNIHFLFWVRVKLCYWFHCSNCFSFGHWELSQLALVFFWQTSAVMGFILFCYEHSLTFWHYKMLWSLSLPLSLFLSLSLSLSHFLPQSLNQTFL